MIDFYISDGAAWMNSPADFVKFEFGLRAAGAAGYWYSGRASAVLRRTRGSRPVFTSMTMQLERKGKKNERKGKEGLSRARSVLSAPYRSAGWWLHPVNNACRNPPATRLPHTQNGYMQAGQVKSSCENPDEV